MAASGDEILRARFKGPANTFIVRASSLVETEPAPLLQACLEGWLPNGQHDPAAVDLAKEALMGSDQRALMFLQQLVEIIQDRVKYTQRHVGPTWPAGRRSSTT